MYVVCQLRLHLKFFDADPDPDPDLGGGGVGGSRSAKNVHPPWQNPRYAPDRTVLIFFPYPV
jgi:hypothetical protein